MKVFLLFFTLPLLLSPAIGSVKALTSSEARTQVESEMAAKEAREERKNLELLSVPAELETTKPLPDGGTILLRRVAPPPPPPARREAAPRQRQWAKAEIAEFLRREAERKAPLNISLSVTVYDGEVSEMRLWHEGEVYSILSNVAFSHLQGFGGFEDDQAEWSLFAMVGQVNEEEEKRKSEEASRFGAEYRPRKRPDTRVFTSLDEPEYLVYSRADQTVPKEVFAKLDALHAYYLINEEELGIQHQRREALTEARRRYQKENPPEPKDIVINFWRKGEKK